MKTHKYTRNKRLRGNKKRYVGGVTNTNVNANNSNKNSSINSNTNSNKNNKNKVNNIRGTTGKNNTRKNNINKHYNISSPPRKRARLSFGNAIPKFSLLSMSD